MEHSDLRHNRPDIPELHFRPEIETRLREAGWYPGREVEEERLRQWYAFKGDGIPGNCRIFPAAYRFLREFGGLALGNWGGVEFLIDPLQAIGHEDLSFYLEWMLETRLYPLGASNSGEVLQIDMQGRFWILPPGQTLLGHTREESLANLLIPGRWQENPPETLDIPEVDWKVDNLLGDILRVERGIS